MALLVPDVSLPHFRNSKKSFSVKQNSLYFIWDKYQNLTLYYIHLSLTWAPTVQAGPASEKLRKGYAFYHNKAPEHGDPLAALLNQLGLVLKSCWRVDRK